MSTTELEAISMSYDREWLSSYDHLMENDFDANITLTKLWIGKAH